MEDEQWFLLGAPLPKDALQLGALVVDYMNPADNYYCPEILVDKQEQLVQNYENHEAKLLPSTTRWTTFKMVTEAKYPSDPVRLKAHDYSISRLQDPLTWFEAFVASVDARDWLLKHFETHHDIYLLAGLQMLRDGELTKIKLGTPGSSTKETWLQLDASLAQVKDLQMKTHKEYIFAVSYLKISLQLSRMTQMPTSPRIANWLRPWSWWSRKEPSYPLKSHRGPILEFVIQSAGFQEAIQCKSSVTLSEIQYISNDTKDSALAPLSVLFGPSADGSSLGIEVWTKLLVGSSDLGPLYREAIKTVPKRIFERLFSQALKRFAVDLEGFKRSKSEVVLAHFVQRYALRTAWLVTRHIYADDPYDPRLSTVNLELPPFLHQYFGRLEAQNDFFTSGEGPDKRDDVIDSPDHDIKRSILLISHHHTVAKSLLFNGPAFVKFWDALGRDALGRDALAWGMRASYPYKIMEILSHAFLLNFVIGFGFNNPSVWIATLFLMILWFEECKPVITEPLYRSLARFIYNLRVVFRPRVKPGNQRIEWICVGIRFTFYDCGTLLYDDFEVAEAESIDGIRQHLNSSGPASGGPSPPPSRSAPALPDQAHVNPAGSVAHEARGRGSVAMQYNSISTQTPSRSPSPVGAKRKKYFELCVNSGKWKITLGEIDITDVKTDQDFFDKVTEKYDSVRGFFANALCLLEPADIHFVRIVILLTLTKEPDSWPTSEAVDKGSWEFCASARISKRNFLHHMRDGGSHPRKRWFPTLPAKLKRRLTDEKTLYPTGWGVHIIEGLNKTLAYMLLFGLTVVTLAIGVFLSIWKGEKVNYGQLCLTALGIIPSFLTSAYIWQLNP